MTKMYSVDSVLYSVFRFPALSAFCPTSVFLFFHNTIEATSVDLSKVVEIRQASYSYPGKHLNIVNVVNMDTGVLI